MYVIVNQSYGSKRAVMNAIHGLKVTVEGKEHKEVHVRYNLWVNKHIVLPVSYTAEWSTTEIINDCADAIFAKLGLQVAKII